MSDRHVQTDGGGMLLVFFRIGPQRYGLPVGDVLEVIRIPALLALAGAPPALGGMLNLRGRYLPVLDGRALVGEPSEYDLDSQIVIVGRATPQFGLLVDRVEAVEAVQGEWRAQRDARTHSSIQGVVEQSGGLSVLLDALALGELAAEASSSVIA